MSKEKTNNNELDYEVIDPVFFPLVFLPAHDLTNNIKLFQWCWDNDIDPFYSCDTIAQMSMGKVLAPGRKPENHMMTLTIFYGRADKNHFKKIFGFDYEIEKLDQIQPFVLKELGIENMAVAGV